MGAVHAKEAVPSMGEQEEETILLNTIRAKVVAVNVEGLARTKDDIVMDSVQDLFQVLDGGCFHCPVWLLGGRSRYS